MDAIVEQLGLLRIINVVVETPYWVSIETPNWNHISCNGSTSFDLRLSLIYPNPRTRTASLSSTAQTALPEAGCRGRALIGEEAGVEAEAEGKSSSPPANKLRHHHSPPMRGSPCSRRRASDAFLPPCSGRPEWSR